MLKVDRSGHLLPCYDRTECGPKQMLRSLITSCLTRAPRTRVCHLPPFPGPANPRSCTEKG